ncbi:hypothetical protein AXF42_Ash012544 [Apostasia shenzhenica]|uniref:Uncharacterized protein n=1 Tax=Apostasia shenzhenica TaxID=1088818 RepID=A0A2I0AR26_9ASPA|nr:hypothetical protein AXF42_Ash012544 [Apostasia shenzhenica]
MLADGQYATPAVRCVSGYGPSAGKPHLLPEQYGPIGQMSRPCSSGCCPFGAFLQYETFPVRLGGLAYVDSAWASTWMVQMKKRESNCNRTEELHRSGNWQGTTCGKEYQSHRNDIPMASAGQTQSRKYTFHSSTVTYGGINGAYYSKSTTRRMGNDGVDKNSFPPLLCCTDKLPGFEAAWKGNAGQFVMRRNSGIGMQDYGNTRYKSHQGVGSSRVIDIEVLPLQQKSI